MKLRWEGVDLVFPSNGRGLHQVSLTLEKGEFHVLAGANGSGKTLLAEMGCGLLKPQKGRILLEDKDLSRNPSWARGRVGLVFQDSESQILGQTIGEDVRFGPDNLGLKEEEIKDRCQNALEITGLKGREEEIVFHLSGGEKKRLALASYLAMECPVLILDEPFNGLDWPGTRDLLRVLLDLHGRGTSLLVITHDLEKVLAHADTLTLMKEGRILATGSPVSLWDRISEADVHPPRVPASELASLSWLRS